MNRLREIRTAQGMTLQALADQVGSAKAYMWQLENKPAPDPGVRLAIKISKALNTPIERIFGCDT